jgi:membrane-associated phospholipid phosphatase
MQLASAQGVCRTRIAVLLLLAAIIVSAAHLLDWWAYENLALPSFQNGDLGRTLRIMGYLPFWGVAAVALVLSDRACGSGWEARPYRRGALLLGAATSGGICAEILKMLIRRERPGAPLGDYVFRSFAEQPFHTGGLGLPSSHALVAFAAVAMLAYLFPRARYVWYALGIGCAFSRVAAGAHFVSDVVISGVIGFALVALIWRRFAPVPQGTEGPASGQQSVMSPVRAAVG